MAKQELRISQGSILSLIACFIYFECIFGEAFEGINAEVVTNGMETE